MGPVNCEVWWGDPAASRPALVGVLSDEERTRLDRLRRQADRDRYLVAHALLRMVLGRRLDIAAANVMLASGDDKPTLADRALSQEFSLSHSERRVVVAVAAGAPIGVDVERVSERRDIDVLSRRVLTPRERATLEGLDESARRAGFHRYWVRKEATVKATGHGLRMALDAVAVSGPDEPAALLAWPLDDPPPTAIRLRDLEPGEGYAACLAACSASDLIVEERDGTALLEEI